MTRALRGLVAAAALVTTLATPQSTWAQKAGGILKVYSIDSPPTTSILELTAANSEAIAL